MWITVAKLTDLTPETTRVVNAGGLELALVRATDGLFALDNLCPHTGGSLGEGLVQGRTVTCPLHNWQFDCQTGKCLTEKRAPQRRYPVKVEKGDVLIEIPDPAPVAVSVEAPKPAIEEWIAVVEVADFRPGTLRQVQVGDQLAVLACSTEGIYALENACAHEGGPLAEGSLEGTVVTCPMHGWKFDCKTGHCLTDARRRQRTFETKIEAGRVWVRAAASPESSIPEAAPASASQMTETSNDPAIKKSPAEIWKIAKPGMAVWPDLLNYARNRTPMAEIEEPELERMKWYGFFYRKNNDNDRYMCRIRIPGCAMTVEQARAIARIACDAGYSIADVTTRGNIQIQGLTVDQLPQVREKLEAVNLTARQTGHDNVRNITSHPFSGIDPDELIDTRDLARQIQEMVIGHPEFTDLPRKFNIALTGRSDPAGHAWTQDLCFVAMLRTKEEGLESLSLASLSLVPDQLEVGFQLLVGGTQGQSPKLAWHLPVWVAPEEVLEVTTAILRTFRELGYRHNRHQVRFRYLIERIGVEQLLLEIEKRLGRALDRLALSAAEGSGAEGLALSAVEGSPPKPGAQDDFIGWFKQKQDDRWAVGVCVPIGRLTWDQLEGMAAIAEQFGDGTLRTTYDQNLVIPGIASADREAVRYAIVRHGLTFEPDQVMRNVVACTGKQFCNIAVTETKGYAYQLIETLRRRKVQLHDIRLHMSGCPSSCAMSHTADIGLKGSKVRRGGKVLDAFDVYLGGGLAAEVQMAILYKKGIPFQQLPQLLEKVIGEFYLEREAPETFSQYWRRKLEGHKPETDKEEIPTWRCTRCEYLHVADDPPPFCPLCAAIRSKFEPVSDEETNRADAVGEHHANQLEAAPKVADAVGEQLSGKNLPGLTPIPQGKRLLIIGGSIAGHTAAQTARSLDPEARITLITDEQYSFYNRLNLTRFLADEVQHAELFDYTPGWYEENQIEILTGTRVIGLDPIQRVALLAEGRELSYDACILAHGSSANTPPFYRANLPGLLLLRTLDDVKEIIARAQSGVKVAVIGGGVLGLEAAYGLVKHGAVVRVFEYGPSLMPRQLDRAGGKLFTEMVREKGIEVHANAQVQEILGETHVEGLALADGRHFDAELIVVSTGIKPNIDWVKRSGLHCQRGVIVNDCMQTSVEGVYAAGDVTEWQGQVVGLWANAIEQARVAAANAVGGLGFYQGCLPVTSLKCLGIPLVSMGEIKEDGEGITSKVKYDLEACTYRRLILRDGIPIGGILLGALSGMGEMRKLIEGGLELEKLRQKVMPDEIVVERLAVPVA